MEVNAMDADAAAEIPSTATFEPVEGDGVGAHRLLAHDPSPAWQAEALRAARGLGLAAIFGAALGLREGGVAIVHHAAVVPAAIGALLGLGVPALHILLALTAAPIGALDLGGMCARAIAAMGMLLAGLSAPIALLMVTAESPASAAAAGGAGLVAAGALALRRFWVELSDAASGADARTRALTSMLAIGFSGFAVLLVGRIWWNVLALVGGAS